MALQLARRPAEWNQEKTLALCAPPTGPLVIGSVSHGVKLSMVVPTYNESENIADLIASLRKIVAAAVGESYEIIVVDDDSPDRTWEIAAAIGENDPRIITVRRTTERGLATAVVRGWQLSRGEVLGVIDGDMQHPVEVTAALWKALSAGADVAVASRYAKGGNVGEWNILRRIVSRVARLMARLLLPKALGRVSDPMSGFFMVRRSLLLGVLLNPLGYKILVEVLGRTAPDAVTEVAYCFRVRGKGHSKATLGVYWQYMVHLIRLRGGNN